MENEVERLRKDSVKLLKESVLICIRELRNPRVESKIKVKWARCLAQQIAALMRINKATSPSDADLATWLSEIKEKIPKKYLASEPLLEKSFQQ